MLAFDPIPEFEVVRMHLASIVNNEDVLGPECSATSGFKDSPQGIGIRLVTRKNQRSIVAILFVRRDGDALFVTKLVLMHGSRLVKGFQVLDHRWHPGSSENADEHDGLETENDDENRQHERSGEGHGLGYPTCVVVGEVDTNAGSSNERETGIASECDGPEVVNRADDLPDGLDGDATVDVVRKLADAVALLGCLALLRHHLLLVEDRRCCRD